MAVQQQSSEPDSEAGGPGRPPRVSDILRSISSRGDLTVGELSDMLGERAFGALMFIFAVPNIIPGVAAILGVPLMFLSFQVMIGRQSLWLPAKVRQRRISGDMLKTLVDKVMPMLIKTERFLRPRLGIMVNSDVAERLLGLTAFPLTVVLFLPILFGNFLPTVAIAFLGLGLAERDGLIVVFGYVLSVSSVAWLAVLAFATTALYNVADGFFRALFGF